MTTMSMLGEVRPEHDCPDELVLLHYLRSFRHPVLEVWAACTEPRQLVRWFGAVSGTGTDLVIEPADGPVPGPLTVHVAHCSAPNDLHAQVDDGTLELHLSQVGVVTNLELIRRHVHPEDAATIGPRWQYLLDRFTAYLNTQPMPQWRDYTDLAGEYR
ncbi:hypothetical protein [Nocardia cyriacigeorgica]|uniref:SRPBCC family protein n=1 Tax=Nocardia cyriacigeorgica (strain GUH-2) TaxID=1127134 RepID=H6R0E5_NOCCG|nr:hypothetical protein [Nocardia cyriacigeorgica]MBF6287380.1 hypothetical protein [Nocardia cyriacigeorgica]BDU07277.1 hypothetical protein FMUBM48_35400 [Nocardia cyriacigeorgica]CCF64213.1 conserved protein of unknown function [Nocardia cyriacigeorgica GUH-2]